jgi:Sporulation related domain.
MRHLFSVIFLVALFHSVGYAQIDTLGVKSANSGSAKLVELLGKLEIRQDARITDMLMRNNQINQKRNGTDGYRLEIYFGSDTKAREKASRVKNEFNVVFPDIASYLLFQTPNFKVRVGDFRNKSEALKAKAFIASKYPNAFIVKDLIRFPELFTESVEQSEGQQ